MSEPGNFSQPPPLMLHNYTSSPYTASTGSSTPTVQPLQVQLGSLGASSLHGPQGVMHYPPLHQPLNVQYHPHHQHVPVHHHQHHQPQQYPHQQPPPHHNNIQQGYLSHHGGYFYGNHLHQLPAGLPHTGSFGAGMAAAVPTGVVPAATSTAASAAPLSPPLMYSSSPPPPPSYSPALQPMTTSSAGTSPQNLPFSNQSFGSPRMHHLTVGSSTASQRSGSSAVPSPTAAGGTPGASLFQLPVPQHVVAHHQALLMGRSPLSRSASSAAAGASTAPPPPPVLVPSPRTGSMGLQSPSPYFGMGGRLHGSIHLQHGSGSFSKSSLQNGLSDSSSGQRPVHVAGTSGLVGSSNYSSTNNDSDVNSGPRGNRKAISPSGGDAATIAAMPFGASQQHLGSGSGAGSGYSSGNSNRSRCSSRGPSVYRTSPQLESPTEGITPAAVQSFSATRADASSDASHAHTGLTQAQLLSLAAGKTQTRKSRGDHQKRANRNTSTTASMSVNYLSQSQRLAPEQQHQNHNHMQPIPFSGLDFPELLEHRYHDSFGWQAPAVASPPPAAVASATGLSEHANSMMRGATTTSQKTELEQFPPQNESQSDATAPPSTSPHPFVQHLARIAASESGTEAQQRTRRSSGTISPVPQGHLKTKRGKASGDESSTSATAAARLPMGAPLSQQQQQQQQAARKAPLEELTAHRISQRSKQIRYGKVTPGYRFYRMFVPTPFRQIGNDRHPETPRDESHISKRHWDVRMREWRRALHIWDAVETEAQAQTLEMPGLPTAGSLSGEDDIVQSFDVETYLTETREELDALQRDVAEYIASKGRLGEIEVDLDRIVSASEAEKASAVPRRRTRRAAHGSDGGTPRPSNDEGQISHDGGLKSDDVEQPRDDITAQPPDADGLYEDLIHEYRHPLPVEAQQDALVMQTKPAPSPVSRRLPRHADTTTTTTASAHHHTDPSHSIAKVAELMSVLSPHQGGGLPQSHSPNAFSSSRANRIVPSPLKQNSLSRHSSSSTRQPQTPPRGMITNTAMTLSSSVAAAASSLSNSPVSAAQNVFQPWIDTDALPSSVFNTRTTVYIIHVDPSATAQGGGSSVKSLPSQGLLGSHAKTRNSRSGSAVASPVLFQQQATRLSPDIQPMLEVPATPPVERIVSPSASVLGLGSPTASMKYLTPPSTNFANSGGTPLGPMPSPMSSMTAAMATTAGGAYERHRDRYALDVCHHPTDVLKCLRVGLGLHTSRLTYVKPHVSVGWELAPIEPTTLYNQEQQLDTIEAVTDWLRQAQPLSSPAASITGTYGSTSSEEPTSVTSPQFHTGGEGHAGGQPSTVMARQMSEDRTSGDSYNAMDALATSQRSPMSTGSTSGSPQHQLQQQRGAGGAPAALRPLFIIHRGPARPQSCEEFAANTSLNTPLLSHQQHPTTPGGKTTPSSTGRGRSASGSPPVIVPSDVAHAIPQPSIAAPPTDGQPHRPVSAFSNITHRVREGSVVGQNGSMFNNASILIASQQSFCRPSAAPPAAPADEPIPSPFASTARRLPPNSEAPSGEAQGVDDLLSKDGPSVDDLLRHVSTGSSPQLSPPATRAQKRHIVFDTSAFPRGGSADSSPFERANQVARLEGVDPLAGSVSRHLHGHEDHLKDVDGGGMNLDPTPTELTTSSPSPQHFNANMLASSVSIGADALSGTAIFIDAAMQPSGQC